jgi:hypothetical protein
MVFTNTIYYTTITFLLQLHIYFCQNIMYNRLQATINIKKETLVKRHIRSLLEELNDIAVQKDTEAVIESRAVHVINSAINLLTLIRENFDPELAYELERRFMNSIKGADPAKFTRGIRKLRDSKETKNTLIIIEGDQKSDD